MKGAEARTCANHAAAANGKDEGGDGGPVVVAELADHDGAGIGAEGDGDQGHRQARGDDGDGDGGPRLIRVGQRGWCRRHCEGVWWRPWRFGSRLAPRLSSLVSLSPRALLAGGGDTMMGRGIRSWRGPRRELLVKCGTVA